MIQSLTELPCEQAREIQFILTDLDDTITTDGALLPETFQALHEASAHGLHVIPVTGGCAGWCDQIARIWPVRSVIGENGAFAILKDEEGRITYDFWQSREAHKQDQARILDVAHRVIADHPGTALALDQGYRLADVAVDINQDVKGVTPAQIQGVIDGFHQAGINAKASSIHVNAWMGDFDKAGMARRLLTQEFKLDDAAMKAKVLYIGDAPNDEPMFQFFPISVGVANIRKHLLAMENHPTYVTEGQSGYGFAEMVRLLIRAKGD